MLISRMVRKSFRFIALICAGSIGLSVPIPALALRQQFDRAGLEEKLAHVRPEPFDSAVHPEPVEGERPAQDRPVPATNRGGSAKAGGGEGRNSSAGLEESLEHPLFKAMQDRQARVRDLAERAQKREIDLGFTPEEVDSLSQPRELLKETIQWELDGDQLKSVTVVRVKDTGKRGTQPSKGGFRFFLRPEVLQGGPFEAVWRRYLEKENPTPEQAQKTWRSRRCR